MPSPIISSLTARRFDTDTALFCVDGCPHLQDQHYLGNMQNFAPSVKIPVLSALSLEQKTLSPITPRLKIVFKKKNSLLDTCIMYVYKKIQLKLHSTEPDLRSKKASKTDFVL
jgi:hypothetical protein